jgi:hypothetical protein
MKGKLAKGQIAIYTTAIEEAEIVVRMIRHVRGIDEAELMAELRPITNPASEWKYEVEIVRIDRAVDSVLTWKQLEIALQVLHDIAEILAFEIEE